MMNLWNQVIQYLGSFNQEQWLWMLLAVGIVAYIFYNRKKYVQLFDNAVVMAETSFNHGDNAAKLEAAIRFVVQRTSTLPFFARFIIQTFINKKRMVDIIEKSLQKFSEIFGSGRKVDIKGNE